MTNEIKRNRMLAIAADHSVTAYPMRTDNVGIVVEIEFSDRHGNHGTDTVYVFGFRHLREVLGY